ncbi:MAG: sulfite exporter TauE/SafE family protein [Deltaproteobacteria bacterium]|nr:sulfite exporter TauE/SafE family protein [Deltaproteobacteria bacterium]MBW2531387.1 sulfite exporter TauE/SafE family protein [Deltaproteobacteria bacterium]
MISPSTSVADEMGQWTPYGMLLLGLLGTAHCLGMCGPLVLALPASQGSFVRHLLYHAGRITTYTIVGTILGGVGAGVAELTSRTADDPMGAVAQAQVVVSLVAAALLGWLGLARLGILAEPAWLAVATPSRVPGFSRVLGRASAGSHLGMAGLGLVLGLLPCGLSFAAFAAALGTGSALEGGLAVLLFGLGTLPGLLLLGTAASKIARKHRRVVELLAGLLLVAMAVSMAADAVAALW